MRNRLALSVMLAALIPAVATAQGKADGNAGKQPPPSGTIAAISPIFSQLVMLAYPREFKVAFEETNGDRYIREAVPAGETVERWTQLITVTGAKGLSANPNATPQAFVEQIASGFKRACEPTFSATAVGETKVSGQDAFMAIVGCGTVGAGDFRRSETALIMAIKGTADFYTIQWAERGPASDKATPANEETWKERYKILSPIRVCARVPGEAAPYPSCVNQK